MIRSLLTAATVATFALTFAPARALACEGEGADCHCKHGKKDAAKPEAKADKKTAPTAKPEEKKDEAQKPAEQHGSVMEQVDQLLAAKCPCASQADCTCKKGECKCSKCSGHKKTVKMIESLRDADDSNQLPGNARMDATAGVFI